MAVELSNQKDQPPNTVVEDKSIDELKDIFKNIKWKKDVIVIRENDEDAKVTLFLDYDKNMPERLIEYSIWFYQKDDTATIQDIEEGYLGSLNQEYSSRLKGILLEE